MYGFFGKKQYAANAPKTLTMKFPKDLCLECSTCAMFFSSSLMVSMMALFLVSSLSDIVMTAPLMLFFSLAISCIPSTKSLWKRYIPCLRQVPIEELHKRLVVKRLTVVCVAWGNHEAEQLAPLVAYQVQLEAEEPSHGALAPPGDAPEGLVHMDALVLAHPERSAVHETDARTLAQQHLLDEQGQRNGYLPLQLHKAVVGHQLWEKGGADAC